MLDRQPDRNELQVTRQTASQDLHPRDNLWIITKRPPDTQTRENMCANTYRWRQHGEVCKHPVQPTINMEMGEIVETALISLINSSGINNYINVYSYDQHSDQI